MEELNKIKAAYLKQRMLDYSRRVELLENVQHEFKQLEDKIIKLFDQLERKMYDEEHQN